MGGERLSSDFSPPSLVHPKSVDPCRLQVPERSSQNEGALVPVCVRGWSRDACEMHGHGRPSLGLRLRRAAWLGSRRGRIEDREARKAREHVLVGSVLGASVLKKNRTLFSHPPPASLCLLSLLPVCPRPCHSLCVVVWVVVLLRASRVCRMLLAACCWLFDGNTAQHCFARHGLADVHRNR